MMGVGEAGSFKKYNKVENVGAYFKVFEHQRILYLILEMMGNQ